MKLKEKYKRVGIYIHRQAWASKVQSCDFLNAKPKTDISTSETFSLNSVFSAAFMVRE
jgi:hypothetical protein